MSRSAAAVGLFGTGFGVVAVGGILTVAVPSTSGITGLGLWVFNGGLVILCGAIAYAIRRDAASHRGRVALGPVRSRIEPASGRGPAPMTDWLATAGPESSRSRAAASAPSISFQLPRETAVVGHVAAGVVANSATPSLPRDEPVVTDVEPASTAANPEIGASDLPSLPSKASAAEASEVAPRDVVPLAVPEVLPSQPSPTVRIPAPEVAASSPMAGAPGATEWRETFRGPLAFSVAAQPLSEMPEPPSSSEPMEELDEMLRRELGPRRPATSPPASGARPSTSVSGAAVRLGLDYVPETIAGLTVALRPRGGCATCGTPLDTAFSEGLRCAHCSRALCSSCYWRSGSGPGEHLCTTCRQQGRSSSATAAISGGRASPTPAGTTERSTGLGTPASAVPPGR